MRIISKLKILCIDYVLLSINLTFICAMKGNDLGMFSRMNLIFKNYGKDSILKTRQREYMTISCHRNTLFWSRKSNPVAVEVNGAVPVVSRSKEAGRCRALIGHKAGSVYIMISMHNTSLILVPFLLLCVIAGPCTFRSAESKKAVPEIHRTQVCVLHI